MEHFEERIDTPIKGSNFYYTNCNGRKYSIVNFSVLLGDMRERNPEVYNMIFHDWEAIEMAPDGSLLSDETMERAPTKEDLLNILRDL